MTTTTVAPYPVRVDATLDSPLSRWLWLVKWLLAIPHYIVLVFLWVAFVVLSVVAFFAILFTGRYPRGIFDFNVGVLRWTWRVQYYTYGALATDRYPPFTLDDRPDYPARLDIAYPERLSHGLVLVKWLLGIPHYIIVGLFVGGGAWFAWQAGNDSANWTGGGLIGLLVLIAAVALAFTGRYPRTLYDFVLGLNRWVLRVAAYGALMTDAYPPFRLDMGEHEPESTMTLPPPPPVSETYAGPPAHAAPPTQRWTAGRVISVVIGSVMVLSSFGLFAGGGVVLWADQHRDGGYVTSSIESYDSNGFAITTDRLSLDGAAFDWGWQSDLLGDVRIRVTGADTTAPVFVGIAASDDVDRYLANVDRTVFRDFAGHDGSYSITGGRAAPPVSQRFWVAREAGTGTQTLVWPVRGGDWTVVVMNADGSRGVHARADIGATVPVLPWVATGLLIGGGVLLLLGLVLVIVPVRRAGR